MSPGAAKSSLRDPARLVERSIQAPGGRRRRPSRAFFVPRAHRSEANGREPGRPAPPSPPHLGRHDRGGDRGVFCVPAGVAACCCPSPRPSPRAVARAGTSAMRGERERWPGAGWSGTTKSEPPPTSGRRRPGRAAGTAAHCPLLLQRHSLRRGWQRAWAPHGRPCGGRRARRRAGRGGRTPKDGCGRSLTRRARAPPAPRSHDPRDLRAAATPSRQSGRSGDRRRGMRPGRNV